MGPWPLDPHHDLITLFTSFTFNAIGVKIGVLHSPPPYNNIVLSALQKWTKMLHWHYLSVLQNWKKWMCQSLCILHLPSILLRTVVLPLHLYLSYGSISEHGDLPVEDAQWLGLELFLRFHLDHIPICHMARIMYIFLKQRNMKNIMSSSANKQCNSIWN